jgi:hypothetical protein
LIQNFNRIQLQESNNQINSSIQLTDNTRERILSLIKELGENNISSVQNDHLSTIKLAFMDKNLYICSTCSGPVQWV